MNCAFNSIVKNLIHAAHGSVFNTITTRTIETASVVVAADELLNRFEAVVQPLFLRALANLEQSVALGQARDLLLPRLMSGEIRLQEAEELVGAVA